MQVALQTCRGFTDMQVALQNAQNLQNLLMPSQDGECL